MTAFDLVCIDSFKFDMAGQLLIWCGDSSKFGMAGPILIWCVVTALSLVWHDSF